LGANVGSVPRGNNIYVEFKHAHVYGNEALWKTILNDSVLEVTRLEVWVRFQMSLGIFRCEEPTYGHFCAVFHLATKGVEHVRQMGAQETSPLG